MRVTTNTVVICGEQGDKFLVNDQRDAYILFCVFISVYNCQHVSSTSCSSSGERNCTNTASGNSNSMLVAEMCAGWKKTLLPTFPHHQERQIVPIQPLVTVILCWWPRCVQVGRRLFFQPSLITRRDKLCQYSLW